MFGRRLVLIALCLILGCSQGVPEWQADESDRRLELLTISLEAWKAGSVAGLARRNPPIRFVDDDWAAGRQLMAYRHEDPDSLSLPFENVFVTLTFQAADGKTVERKVGYQIALIPAFAVLRSEP
jgi:hypothetical protein